MDSKKSKSADRAHRTEVEDLIPTENLPPVKTAPDYIRRAAEQIRTLVQRPGAVEGYRRQVRDWAASELARNDQPAPERRGVHDLVTIIELDASEPLDLPSQFAITAAIHDVVFSADPVDPWFASRLTSSDDELFERSKQALPYGSLKSSILGEAWESGMSATGARRAEGLLDEIAKHLPAIPNAPEGIEDIGFLGISFDAERAVASRVIDGHRVSIELYPRDASILDLLLRNRGGWSTNREIEDLWETEGKSPEASTVRSAVSRLESKLAGLGVTVETRPGIGKRLSIKAEPTPE